MLFGGRVRVEHWANAPNGVPPPQNMPRRAIAYDRVPYSFSDQYEVGMEYSGHAPAWDEVPLRGDPDALEFIAFWLRDGRVLAGMNVNVWDVNEAVQAIVRSGRPVDRRAMADPDVPLEALANPAKAAS
jgi:3-phenylpropionate/trans-cinnamate dioxygenase ferredoxin reductase subunit